MSVGASAAKPSDAGSSKSVKSTALAEDAVEPHPGPASEPTAAYGDGWTGTLYPSLRCDYCGVEVVGSDAPSLDSAKEAHRETCPERTAACPNCGHALAKTNRGWWWCSRCERRMRLKDSVGGSALPTPGAARPASLTPTDTAARRRP